jgi:Domain of unknown function (DUF4190)
MGTPPDREGEQGGGHSWQPPRPEQPVWQGQQPAPQSGWQQPAGGGGWAQAGGAKTSGKSTAALVLGILGLLFCPLICSVLALVLGYQSRREIDAAGGRLGGRGNATAGIVLGWIGIAIMVALIVLFGIGFSLGGDGEISVPDEPTSLS